MSNDGFSQVCHDGALALLSEAETLKRIRITFFPDIEPPREPADAGAEEGHQWIPT